VDDGVHPVDVTPIGQEKEKGIPALTEFPQGATQLPESVTGGLAQRPSYSPTVRFPHPEE
jgi:hypothetical protein